MTCVHSPGVSDGDRNVQGFAITPFGRVGRIHPVCKGVALKKHDVAGVRRWSVYACAHGAMDQLLAVGTMRELDGIRNLQERQLCDGSDGIFVHIRG